MSAFSVRHKASFLKQYVHDPRRFAEEVADVFEEVCRELEELERKLDELTEEQ